VPTAPHAEPGPRPDDGSGRQSDVLAMHRLARRADGGAALLEWLGRRAGSWAGLVDRSGAVLLPAQSPPVDPAVLASGVGRMRERGLPAYVVGDDALRVALLAVDAAAGAQNPFLAVVDPGRVATTLLSDAAVLLATSWAAEHARRTAARVQRAEARCREAVLHLLMGQHLGTARQLASTLSPALPETTRVHVIETSAARRGEVVDRCAELTGGNAWIVRCPVYSRHVIVLADGVDDPAGRPLDRAVATELPGCTVGAGDAVPLRDTAVGYEQAFHALAVARRRPEGWARFDAALDLASVLGADGIAWAEVALAPLTGHVPARATDPDADELIMTARSWLAFSTAASRHLTIHRNTLALRVKRIEDLLGVDLARLDQQAWLDLALRIRSAPGRAGRSAPRPDRPPGPDELLRLPGAQRWADAALRPVRRSAHAPQLETTLRTWLDTGARLSATADTLQLSVAGTRRRIERLEQVLQRSLLHGPSARNDLWLALRAVDLGCQERGRR
jgi:PucR-like helix-turn-helix protein